MIELRIGIVGATGVVGQTALDILLNDFSGFKLKSLSLFASKASVGKRIPFGLENLIVQEMSLESLKKCDAVLFASDAAISAKFIPELARQGVLCVDKSSAFRENATVPLVVPEANGDELLSASLFEFPVVASPNCCTIPLVMSLKPLMDTYGVERVIVSTYQSVSGAGKPGVDVLREESTGFFNLEDVNAQRSNIFPKPIAFNVMPFVSKILENGDTDEESKIISETRKILKDPDLKISATSVRVPTFVGHAEAVTVELRQTPNLKSVKNTLASFPGVCLVDETLTEVLEDDDAIALFPTPRDVQGKDAVFVGRVRLTSVFDKAGVALWIVSDNLRKGAALNAVQIMNACAENGLMKSLQERRSK